MSGLFIAQTNGLPGSALSVNIQGRNSIQSGNAPLYIIDGMPFPAVVPFSGVSSGPLGVTETEGNLPVGSGSALNYLNPSDIETITILKDADATSIYGSRAANWSNFNYHQERKNR